MVKNIYEKAKEEFVKPFVKGIAAISFAIGVGVTAYPGDNFVSGIEERVKLEQETEISKMAYNNSYGKRCFDKIDGYIHLAYDQIEKVPDYIKPTLLRSLIFVESSYDNDAVSKSGARGLGQLKKIAWNQVEEGSYYRHVFDPKKNVETTLKYLVWEDDYLKKKYEGWEMLPDEKKLEMVLAGYNGGITKLKNNNWDIEKMPKETKDYLKKIKNRMSHYEM